MLADFRFLPSGFDLPNDSASRPSDRQGRYPVQSGSAAAFSVFFGNVPANYSAVDKLAYGIDTGTGMAMSVSSKGESNVVSPLTSLLLGTNTETKLKTQLGLSGSLFQLVDDRSLKNFSVSDGLASTDSAVVADAERLVAHHLRVQSVAAALSYMLGQPMDPSIFRDYDFAAMRSYLDRAPATFIYTNANMSALLGSKSNGPVNPPGTYRADVISAAAHLVNAYVAAIPVRIASRDESARFGIGIWGYLIPSLTRLLRANDASTASEMLALSTPQILDATARFAERLPFDGNDSFFPQPDFYFLARGGSYTVPAVDEGSNGDGPLNSNDVHAQPSQSDGNHFVAGRSQVSAISIPSANVGEVSALLNADGTVSIHAIAGFSGVTYFDYTVRHSAGDVEQGRVHVTVR
jgi:hypothetical protein